ncbi:MAG: M23 family metallopeptidase [Thermoactinomyces sp.]
MKPEEPKNQVSDFEKAKRRLKWKKLFAQKWFFPAVYLTSAALILAIAWWYQDYRIHQVSETTKRTIQQSFPIEEIPSNPTDDDLVLPVAKDSHAVKTMGFYDEGTSKEAREASLVKYANTYWPHSGIDFARKDGKTFDVVAALEGKVVRVEANPVVGYQVEIQHDSGITTVYQSLKEVKVKKGQMVKKGQVIAKAGRNNFEKEAGIHLHFEVRNKDHQAVNPVEYLPNA